MCETLQIILVLLLLSPFLRVQPALLPLLPGLQYLVTLEWFLLAGATFGDVEASCFVAGAKFDDVSVSLLVASAAFGDSWSDTFRGKRNIFVTLKNLVS